MNKIAKISYSGPFLIETTESVGISESVIVPNSFVENEKIVKLDGIHEIKKENSNSNNTK